MLAHGVDQPTEDVGQLDLIPMRPAVKLLGPRLAVVALARPRHQGRPAAHLVQLHRGWLPAEVLPELRDLLGRRTADRRRPARKPVHSRLVHACDLEPDAIRAPPPTNAL